MNMFEYRVRFISEDGHLEFADTFVVEAEDSEKAMDILSEECGDGHELEFTLIDVR